MTSIEPAATATAIADGVPVTTAPTAKASTAGARAAAVAAASAAAAPPLASVAAAEKRQVLARNRAAVLYAVHRGHTTGVCLNEDELRRRIDGFDEPVWAVCATMAQAKRFVKTGKQPAAAAAAAGDASAAKEREDERKKEADKRRLAQLGIDTDAIERVAASDAVVENTTDSEKKKQKQKEPPKMKFHGSPLHKPAMHIVTATADGVYFLPEKAKTHVAFFKYLIAPAEHQGDAEVTGPIVKPTQARADLMSGIKAIQAFEDTKEYSGCELLIVTKSATLYNAIERAASAGPRTNYASLENGGLLRHIATLCARTPVSCAFQPVGGTKQKTSAPPAAPKAAEAAAATSGALPAPPSPSPATDAAPSGSTAVAGTDDEPLSIDIPLPGRAVVETIDE